MIPLICSPHKWTATYLLFWVIGAVYVILLVVVQWMSCCDNILISDLRLLKIIFQEGRGADKKIFVIPFPFPLPKASISTSVSDVPCHILQRLQLKSISWQCLGIIEISVSTLTIIWQVGASQDFLPELCLLVWLHILFDVLTAKLECSFKITVMFSSSYVKTRKHSIKNVFFSSEI